MNKYGLIGFPLTHSFSKAFFEEKFKREGITGHTYNLYPLASIDRFLHLLTAEPELKGLNVTIPYKEAVLQYLSAADAMAIAIGAVNCIKITGKHLKGYNTDAPAFEESLKGFLTVMPRHTFVLGTGGGAKAVCYVLKKNNISYLQVSRKKAKGYLGYNDILKNMSGSNLFINTTPAGMFPDTTDCPDIPYAELTSKDFLFDLIYNPAETEFLRRGKERGALIKNGLEMLQLQAEKSWEIWNS